MVSQLKNEECFVLGIVDLAQRSSIILAPFMQRSGYLSAHLVLSFIAAAGCCFAFPKRTSFRLLDFGSQSDPELVPDYTLPILDIYCRTIRAVIRCKEGLRIFHQLRRIQ